MNLDFIVQTGKEEEEEAGSQVPSLLSFFPFSASPSSIIDVLIMVVDKAAAVLPAKQRRLSGRRHETEKQRV